ncbi:MAG: hypothetical protein ACUVTB_04440 [Candidatus Bathycorpusculaceae bacterium]
METIGGHHLKRLEKQAVKLRRRLERGTRKLREKLLSDLETMFNTAKANVEAARHDKDKIKQVQENHFAS